MRKIRIVLADDQAIVRQGLAYILNAQPDMEVVGEASDGNEAVEVVTRTIPDVVLMDIQMPKRTGIEATEHIVQCIPGIKVILLTTFDVQEYVYDGIRAGAIGYLLKDTDARDLTDAVRLSDQGAAIYRTTTAGKALAQALTTDRNNEAAAEQFTGLSHETLTAREIEVLQLMAYGKRNSEISSLLFISEGTVKTHVHAILQKLSVEDPTQAVVIAIRQQIVK